jgi:hypothetical protein
MNSIPQQAVAKGYGHSEFDRAQATMVSKRVVKKSAPPPGPFRGSCAGSGCPWLTITPLDFRFYRLSETADRAAVACGT